MQSLQDSVASPLNTRRSTRAAPCATARTCTSDHVSINRGPHTPSQTTVPALRHAAPAPDTDKTAHHMHMQPSLDTPLLSPDTALQPSDTPLQLLSTHMSLLPSDTPPLLADTVTIDPCHKEKMAMIGSGTRPLAPGLHPTARVLRRGRPRRGCGPSPHRPTAAEAVADAGAKGWGDRRHRWAIKLGQDNLSYGQIHPKVVGPT